MLNLADLQRRLGRLDAEAGYGRERSKSLAEGEKEGEEGGRGGRADRCR